MSETKKPAWNFSGHPSAQHVSGLQATLTLRRSGEPAPRESAATLLPELQQTVDDFNDSPRVARYRKLAADLTVMETNVAEFAAAATKARDRKAFVAESGESEELTDAQVALECAEGDLAEVSKHRDDLREAAERVRAELAREWQSQSEKLANDLANAEFGTKRQILDELAAILSPYLDRLARCNDKITRGRISALPGLDKLLPALPAKAEAVAAPPVPDLFVVDQLAQPVA